MVYQNRSPESNNLNFGELEKAQRERENNSSQIFIIQNDFWKTFIEETIEQGRIPICYTSLRKEDIN